MRKYRNKNYIFWSQYIYIYIYIYVNPNVSVNRQILRTLGGRFHNLAVKEVTCLATLQFGAYRIWRADREVQSVGWSCRALWLFPSYFSNCSCSKPFHIKGATRWWLRVKCVEKKKKKENKTWYATELHLMGRLQSNNLKTVEYPFITNTLSSTLTWNGSTSSSPIYGSNRIVNSFTKDYYY